MKLRIQHQRGQKLSGEPIVLNGRSLTINMSARVLTACVAITGGDYQTLTAMEKATWTNIPHVEDGDVPGTKPFTSSHMADALRPSGVNVGMLDGHVEYVRTTMSRGSAGLTFYF